MSNFFTNPQGTVKKAVEQNKKNLLSIKQKAPTPTFPTSVYGQPVKPLQDHGVYMPIQEVNQKVKEITDAHDRVLGGKPTPALIFDLLRADPLIKATDVSYEDMLRMTPKSQLEKEVRKTSITYSHTLPEELDTHKLIQGMIGAAHENTLDKFMEEHDSMIEEALRDPDTKKQMNQAIKDANAYDSFYKNFSHESPEHFAKAVVKGLAKAPPNSLAFAGRTTSAGALDASAAGLWGVTGGKKGSVGFEHLEQVAPAVAQVVKGLVYSPVGLYNLGKAINDDIEAADPLNLHHFGKSDTSFKRTRQYGEELVKQVWEDLNHPYSRAGYLFLDATAVLSLGAGTAARLGRAGTVGRETGSAGAAIAAFREPHPLQTFPLSWGKDAGVAWEAEMRLAQNPIFRYGQEWYYNRLQTKLDTKIRGDSRQSYNLWGDPIESLYPGHMERVMEWARETSEELGVKFNPLAAERFIGRARNIRRQTNDKLLMSANVHLHDTFGSAIRLNAITRILPSKLRSQLTVGEMKAIESLTYDLSQGLDPIEVMTENAQWALDNHIGSRRGWERQMDQLAQAKKAMENPRPEFFAALEAIKRANLAQETLKKEMGLLTDIEAENRIIMAGYLVEHFKDLAIPIIKNQQLAKKLQQLRSAEAMNPNVSQSIRAMEAELEANKYPFALSKEGRLAVRKMDWSEDLPSGGLIYGEVLVPLERNRDDSWYFNYELKGKAAKRIPKTTLRTSPMGIAPGVLPDTLKHEMTGEAYIHGNYRIDINNLTGEQLTRMARIFTQWTEYQDIWKNSVTEADRKPWFIPVRSTTAIPDNLRELLSQFADERLDKQGSFSKKLAEDLTDEFYPKTLKVGDDVRWIDPRLLGGAHKIYGSGKISELFARTNNVLRPLIFYLYPKYALNAIGNSAMLVLDQGFMRSYKNLVQALRIDDILSPEDASAVRAAVGAGKTEAFLSGGADTFNRVMADFWTSLTDERFRVAAWIHYARIKGYKTPEDWHTLITEERADFIDVSRRANESLVAFDRLSPAERAIVRNFIFVYPWQRGAFMWSFRAVFEHPQKTALLALLGEDAYQQETWLKHAIAWVRRTGFIPFNFTDGKIHAYDPTSINTFQVWNDVLQTTKAAIYGDRYAALGDALGPPGQMVTHALLGVDENGNRYEGSNLWGAAKGALTVIPALAVVEARMRAAEKKGLKPDPIDIRRRSSLIRRQNSYLDQLGQDPGALGGFGRLIYGHDAWLNMPAQVARYWRDAPPKQKFAHETQLILKMLDAQGKYLGKKVPAEVKKAVIDQRQYTNALDVYSKSRGLDGPPTKAQQIEVRIKYYRDAGRMTVEQEQKYLKQLARVGNVPTELNQFNAKLNHLFGYSAALVTWDADIRKAYNVVNFFRYRTVRLEQYGLGKTQDMSKKNRLAYGRGYNNYLEGLHKLQDKKVQGTATAQDVRQYVDEHDHPVDIAGYQLPSYPRFEFSERSNSDMYAHVAKLQQERWENLTTAEKKALGRDVSLEAQKGWDLLDNTAKRHRDAYGSLPSDIKDQYAAQIAKFYPGFAEDYAWSKKTKVERIFATPQYKDLPPEAKQVFQVALKVVKAINQAKANEDSASAAGYKKQWRDYVDTSLNEWLDRNSQLHAALVPYGKRFLRNLINSG